MNELPEFWRTEIWHPLSVHFPLAILLLGTLLLAAGFFFKKAFWENMGGVLLLMGTVSAWIAVYTGNLAEGTVSRQICDPTVLKTHQTNSYVLAWLFTAASAVIVVDYLEILPKIRTLLKVSIILLAVVGSGFLAYTGHLGATLVYQQAAGVYTPSENCIEFYD